MNLEARLRDLLGAGTLNLPALGGGQTPERHLRLLEIGRADLSVARLAEAHVDAVAILQEAGRTAQEGALYGVWAAETPGRPLRLEQQGNVLRLVGSKMFCTGAGIIDRALITITIPDERLLEVDLRANASFLGIDTSAWATQAFAATNTATVSFDNVPLSAEDFVGSPHWYLERPGFWHGACGPAACWAGGAVGLVDQAFQIPRDDAHTLAHLGAMHSQAWALETFLVSAGLEIDNAPLDREAAHRRALTLRHLVEQAASDILRRLARAYGPRALAFNAKITQHYQELDLYVRQSHAERDLEVLGRNLLLAARQLREA